MCSRAGRGEGGLMSDFVQRASQLLAGAGAWIGPLLAGAAFVQALPGIGIFVPVTALLIASGAAMGTGLVGPGLLPWVMLGGFLGASASYGLGRRLRARGACPPRLPARAQVLAEGLFLRHGAAAVVVARFIGPPTILPLLCGWWALPSRRFLLAQAGASLMWPPAMLAVGALGAWLAGRVG